MAWTPFTRLDHDRSGQRYTSDMTEREFALIWPHLPGQPRRGRKRRTNLRAVVDGIFYVLQNGCPWANLPKDFPPKSTVYGYFRRFLDDGTWERIHDALYVDCRDLEGRDIQPSAAIIDSQSVKTAEKGGIAATTAARKSRDANDTSWSTRWDCCSSAMSIPPPSRTVTARPACSTN